MKAKLARGTRIVMAGIARSVASRAQARPARPSLLSTEARRFVDDRPGTGGRGGRNTEFQLGLAVAHRGAPNMLGDRDDGRQRTGRRSIFHPGGGGGPGALVVSPGYAHRAAARRVSTRRAALAAHDSLPAILRLSWGSRAHRADADECQRYSCGVDRRRRAKRPDEVIHASTSTSQDRCNRRPATNSPEMLKALLLAGVDTFRLNFSHGTQGDHAKVHAAIRKAGTGCRPSDRHSDGSAGPKIRVGNAARRQDRR